MRVTLVAIARGGTDLQSVAASDPLLKIQMAHTTAITD